MKIIFSNNFYPFYPVSGIGKTSGHYPSGGTETSLKIIRQTLEEMNHEVRFLAMRRPDNPKGLDPDTFVPFMDFTRNNGVIDTVAKAGRILYSLKARKCAARMIRANRPDVIHLHTIWHQLSPSMIHEAANQRIPIVMTLHNFKMVCANYQLRRNNRICEECRGGKYWRGFVHRCVKGSLLKSLLCMTELYLHNALLRTFSKVDLFIAPSLFLKNKVRELGFNGDVVHMPNPVPIEDLRLAGHGFLEFPGEKKPSVCYCGRLSGEKGLHTLLDTAAILQKNDRGQDIQVKIIGDGPLRQELETRVRHEGIRNVRFLGFLSGRGLYEEIRKCRCIIMPSECYENNPLAVIEAFCLGVPAVGARIGGIPELVRDEETGYTFAPHDALDCAQSVLKIIMNPHKSGGMGETARKRVESMNDPVKYCSDLIDLYAQIGQKKGQTRAT